MNTSCLRIGRDEINLAEDIKLLGVTLGKDLNFDNHIADIARKVDNQMRVLQRYKKLIDTDAKIGLYNAYLFPHLDYCSIDTGAKISVHNAYLLPHLDYCCTVWASLC